ncbi:MAG: adenosine-specific kinase [Pseudomonadota bacterium]|nr:adenosine-specific kinase [Pseudomonadota bacterium]
MELSLVTIKNPGSLNMILGMSHFIKTVEDIHEAMVNAVPGARFGLAFCEASDVCLIRTTGTDPELVDLARENALAISAGHSFVLFMRDMFPINVLKTVQNVPEVVRTFCATANPVQVIVAQTDQGRGILGVVDGFASKGVETEEDKANRANLLRTIGYKL